MTPDIITMDSDEGFVDYVALMADPRTSSQRLLIKRVYTEVKERLDLRGNVAWVRLRKVLQGGFE